MKGLTINVFISQNPVLMEKGRGCTDVRAVLESLAPGEIGDLIIDCDFIFLQTIKNMLAAHIENMLKKLRKHEQEGVA